MLFRMFMQPGKVAPWMTPCAFVVFAGNLVAYVTSDPHAVSPKYGGTLVISERAEPRTLNPVTAVDSSSRDIIGLFTADLIHINRHTKRTEAALASSWTVSSDCREYTLHLRRDVQFSDGHPFDADDVVFTFQVYLDEKIHSPQRDMLMISGTPIRLEKIDNFTVRFILPEPFAAGERIFDGVAVLPRHLLQAAYEHGQITHAWTLNTPPGQLAGLGPFRFKEYFPGRSIVLERNPHYWKKDQEGRNLPYLSQIVALFTANSSAEAMRFEQGELDIISRLNPADFSVLQKHQSAQKYKLYDLGPGLEYNFLFFNLNELSSKALSAIERKQRWFRQTAFRQAVSKAIDRAAIARLAYGGRAIPLATNVTLANNLWRNQAILTPQRNVSDARAVLQRAGFAWTKSDQLVDANGQAVNFSILFNAANEQQMKTAALIQDDLKGIGLDTNAVPLEYRALLDRIFNTYDYEAAIMSIVGGDTDPNSDISVWESGGGTHIWELAQMRSRPPWQNELDRLMREQMITMAYGQRKRLYDRVQEIISEDLPITCLVGPDVLVGAAAKVQNFNPAVLNQYALWNVEELFLKQ